MKLPRRKRVATAQPPVHKGVGQYGPPITLDPASQSFLASPKTRSSVVLSRASLDRVET